MYLTFGAELYCNFRLGSELKTLHLRNVWERGTCCNYQTRLSYGKREALSLPVPHVCSHCATGTVWLLQRKSRFRVTVLTSSRYTNLLFPGHNFTKLTLLLDLSRWMLVLTKYFEPYRSFLLSLLQSMYNLSAELLF